MTSFRRPGSARTRGAIHFRPVLAFAIGAYLVATLAACSEKVPIDEPDMSDTTEETCAKLIEELPETVGGQQQREMEPANALGAAWGEPAIVLTCGVPLPDDVVATDGTEAPPPCQEVDGVGWFVPEDQIADQSADVVMTTIDFSPAVQVQLPAAYRPTGAAMVDLAPAIKKTLEPVDRCK